MGNADVSPLWYWLVFFAYIVFLIVVGLNAYRTQKATASAEEEHNDYWITGRSQPAYMVGMSVASGWMLIGMITWMTWATYDLGLSGLWVVAIPWFFSNIWQFLMARPLRRIKAISQCQMLEKRFGLPARILSAPINIFSYTIWSAAELYAASLIMAPALGISIEAMIIIYAIPIAIYMWMGGFRSVINANVVQFFMGAIILIVTAVAMYLTAKGIATAQGTTILGMLEAQPIVNSMAYPVDSTQNSASFFAYVSLSFPLIVMLGLVPGWAAAEDFWLKAQAARSTSEARRGGLYSLTFNTFIIVAPAAIIGLFGLIVFPPEATDGVYAAASSLGDKGAYNIISAYINTYMPPMLKGLLIFLLSAHTMSTVANYSNITAMNLSYDVLQPLIYKKRNWSDAKIVKWSRMVTVFMIVINILLALLYNSPVIGATLNDAYFLSSGLLTAGISVMLYVLWWKRATLLGVMLGGLFGTLGTFIFFILEYKVWAFSYNTPIWDWIFGPGAMANSYYGYCVVGLVCGIAGVIIGTYASPPPTAQQLSAIADEPIDNNEEFFAGMHS
ncbi:sodium:solute symporter family protein [Desulfosporosinus hippei]|uniref:Solute:Na+ symporter, SSS family n=1 Tax=Desulfosporosinus hippei DSM 8344 TaxID=1121419 RepID=A0A1G8KAI3_9FIRM|nr:sodium:solute symporter [Desulfosporosinus hippei]SDI40397.1 solute:Na+ symporter, SSS family [Desulfosporosinus hippei DSM 8344]